MHLWHKWVKKEQQKGNMTASCLGRDYKLACIATLYECSCGEKKATVEDLNGNITRINPRFIEDCEGK